MFWKLTGFIKLTIIFNLSLSFSPGLCSKPSETLHLHYKSLSCLDLSTSRSSTGLLVETRTSGRQIALHNNYYIDKYKKEKAATA